MSRARIRGLTLVELLLALGLLGSLSFAIAGWTTTCARLSGKTAPEVRWRAAAAATLRQVGDDLLAGDFLGEKSVRVMVEDGSLTIRTRGLEGGGPVEHAFAFDPAARSLDLVETVPRPNGAPDRTVRRLLSDVSDFRVTLDLEKQTLAVLLTGPNGLAASRAWSVP
ncbi:MAG: hypothetical protein HY812_19295 [Planctomycetes bacterium]|nr:hypothetical protein [Planctomycetota bacterium]